MERHQVMGDHVPDLPLRLQQQAVYYLIKRELSPELAGDAKPQANPIAREQELQHQALNSLSVDGRVQRLGDLRL
jgi:hypothetical protein